MVVVGMELGRLVGLLLGLTDGLSEVVLLGRWVEGAAEEGL